MIGRLLVLALAPLVVGVGCSKLPDCDSDEVVLAEADGHSLTCGEVDQVVEWAELLGARELPGGDTLRVRKALARSFRSDPTGVESRIGECQTEHAQLSAKTGMEAAELRSQLAFSALADDGRFADNSEVHDVVNSVIAPWSIAEDEELVLTEVDIEGWIYYASLCREVQGAVPLRVSVADRVTLYRMFSQRYEDADRDEKLALSAIGAFWGKVKPKWKAASYEAQQAWVKAAPLPGPAVATSLGYTSLIAEGPVTEHARVLHAHFGPLSVTVLR